MFRSKEWIGRALGEDDPFQMTPREPSKSTWFYSTMEAEVFLFLALFGEINTIKTIYRAAHLLHKGQVTVQQFPCSLKVGNLFGHTRPLPELLAYPKESVIFPCFVEAT